MAASSFSLANSIHSKLCRFKTLIKPLQPATRHFPSITEIEAISVSSSSLTECSKSDVPPVRLITFIRFPPVAIASLSFWAIRTNSILIMKVKISHTVVQFHYESDDNWLVRHSCKKNNFRESSLFNSKYFERYLTDFQTDTFFEISTRRALIWFIIWVYNQIWIPAIWFLKIF